YRRIDRLRPSGHIYQVSQSGESCALRQTEIISSVIQVHLDLETLGQNDVRVIQISHPLAILLTQDCDLEQDFKVRTQLEQETNPSKKNDLCLSDKLLPSVLFCNVVTAQQQRSAKGINSEMWTRIKQNKDERYHFLQGVEISCDTLEQGLGEMAIDFKRYFT